jgi:hypothetical protein
MLPAKVSLYIEEHAAAAAGCKLDALVVSGFVAVGFAAAGFDMIGTVRELLSGVSAPDREDGFCVPAEVEADGVDVVGADGVLEAAAKAAAALAAAALACGGTTGSMIDGLELVVLSCVLSL